MNAELTSFDTTFEDSDTSVDAARMSRELIEPPGVIPILTFKVVGENIRQTTDACHPWGINLMPVMLAQAEQLTGTVKQW